MPKQVHLPKQINRRRPTRIFMSYNRKDSTNFVERLSKDLNYIFNDEQPAWCRHTDES